MTDEIRKKHEAQRSYVLETQGDAAYLNQSIKSGLTISEVDALFKALDEARGKVEKVREEIAHAISGGYGILPEELEEILK